MTFDAETRAAYATHAAAYADDWAAQPLPTDLQDAVRSHFRSGTDGGVTGDIGSGSGRDVDWLNRHGYPCIGFDGSTELLDEARRRFPDWRFEHAELPLLDAIAPRTFDNIVCETVLMHLPNDEMPTAIDALRRCLRANGVLYLSWRVADREERDERGRLYSVIDASAVHAALDRMTVLHSAEAISASSGKRIHAIVARLTDRSPRGASR